MGWPHSLSAALGHKALDAGLVPQGHAIPPNLPSDHLLSTPPSRDLNPPPSEGRPELQSTSPGLPPPSLSTQPWIPEWPTLPQMKEEAT